jgi:mannose-6-phosphate isomerase-like protein (cupin superfamily)
MAITVTDMRGATIRGVQVDVAGPTPRMGETDAGGQVNFPGLTAGTYRLRFSGEPVTAFEKEVTLRGGQIADFDIVLSEAPPKPEPPPAPAPVVAPPPPAPVVGPVGQLQSLSVPDVLEKEFVGRQPRRESLLSCSGNTRTTMIQLNEPQTERLYAEADAVYYVIGGEGSIGINGKDVRLTLNGLVSVPRGTSHSFQRRGNRPLILLAVLSGEPCEQAK